MLEPWAGPLGVARILSDRQSILLCILQSIFSGLNDLILAAPPLGGRHTSRQMVIARASLGKDLRDQVRSGEERSVAGVHRAFDKRGNLSCLVPLPFLIPSVSHSTCDVTGRRWAILILRCQHWVRVQFAGPLAPFSELPVQFITPRSTQTHGNLGLERILESVGFNPPNKEGAKQPSVGRDISVEGA